MSGVHHTVRCYHVTETDAKLLLSRIADHFPDIEIVFDMIPEWYSRKTLKGMNITRSYKAPPMPWGMNYGKCDDILAIHPAIKWVQKMTFAELYPERMRPYSYMRNIRWITNKLSPWMAHIRIMKY